MIIDPVIHKMIHCPYNMFIEKNCNHEISRKLWRDIINIKIDPISAEILSLNLIRERKWSFSFFSIENTQKLIKASAKRIKYQTFHINHEKLLAVQKLLVVFVDRVPNVEIQGIKSDIKHNVIPTSVTFPQGVIWDVLK